MKNALLAAAFILTASFSNLRAQENPTLHFISVLPKANLKLTESLGSGVYNGNNLAELPKGEQTLAKKRFKIEESLIHLSSGTQTKDKPTNVNGIKVNCKFAKLNILHGTGFGGPGDMGDPLFVADGTLIGGYTVHYDDKTTQAIPILYGEDVRDWFNWDNSKPVTRGVVAWEGTNDYVKAEKIKLRLYLTTWENPHPSKLVTRIDYRSTNTVCSPFCVAMTAESAAQETSLASLFEGIPAELGIKLKENRVRVDRVNDWLQEHVNKKEKAVAVRLPVRITPTRTKDGTYKVGLDLKDASVNVLGGEWPVRLSDGTGRRDPFSQSGSSFEFEGVSITDAEKLADLQEVIIEGKVKEAQLQHIPDYYYISLVLTDVQVNGRKYSPSTRPTMGGGGKKGFGGGKKGFGGPPNQ